MPAPYTYVVPIVVANTPPQNANDGWIYRALTSFTLRRARSYCPPVFMGSEYLGRIVDMDARPINDEEIALIATMECDKRLPSGYSLIAESRDGEVVAVRLEGSTQPAHRDCIVPVEDARAMNERIERGEPVERDEVYAAFGIVQPEDCE